MPPRTTRWREIGMAAVIGACAGAFLALATIGALEMIRLAQDPPVYPEASMPATVVVISADDLAGN